MDQNCHKDNFQKNTITYCECCGNSLLYSVMQEDCLSAFFTERLSTQEGAGLALHYAGNPPSLSLTSLHVVQESTGPQLR